MSYFMNFFSMGGYAAYVWPAYGIAAILLTVQVVLTRKHDLKSRKKIKLWYKRQGL